MIPSSTNMAKATGVKDFEMEPIANKVFASNSLSLFTPRDPYPLDSKTSPSLTIATAIPGVSKYLAI